MQENLGYRFFLSVHRYAAGSIQSAVNMNKITTFATMLENSGV